MEADFKILAFFHRTGKLQQAAMVK